MHLNIRGIPKNIDKLSNYLTLIDLQFSITVLSKTWLNNETSEIYELPDTEVFTLRDVPEKEEEYLCIYTDHMIT